MIGYLQGTVHTRLAESVLLLTPGGVGYQVHVPLPLLAELGPGQSEACLYVVTLVRDDQIALYGFDTLESRHLFQQLIAVTGIGPRVALALLSAFSPEALSNAIIHNDAALLATIPGIGKKTATRLCVELADKLAKAAAATPASAARADLISALTNLGFAEKDVLSILPRLPDEAETPFAEQLKQALALLRKG